MAEQIIFDISEKFLATYNVDEDPLEFSLRKTGEFLLSDSGCIIEYQNNTCRVLREWNNTHTEIFSFITKNFLAIRNGIKKTGSLNFQTGELDAFNAENIKSFIATGLNTERNNIGFMCFHSADQKKTLSSKHERFVRTIGNIVACQLEKQRIETSLSELQNRERLLKSELDGKNIALNSLRGLIESEKNCVRENMALNIHRNIKPVIKKLRSYEYAGRLGEDYLVKIDMLERFLTGIDNDFYRRAENWKINLTASEIRISHLIKSGYSLKEISDILNISVNTVKNHSRNIRKKLGINNGGQSLKKYFHTPMEEVPLIENT